jgi:hypothetical protein
LRALAGALLATPALGEPATSNKNLRSRSLLFDKLGARGCAAAANDSLEFLLDFVKLSLGRFVRRGCFVGECAGSVSRFLSGHGRGLRVPVGALAWSEIYSHPKAPRKTVLDRRMTHLLSAQQRPDRPRMSPSTVCVRQRTDVALRCAESART